MRRPIDAVCGPYPSISTINRHAFVYTLASSQVPTPNQPAFLSTGAVMPRPTTPHDFQTAAQRIDPDRVIRTFLPPTLDDLLAFAVLVALIATLLFLPAFL